MTKATGIVITQLLKTTRFFIKEIIKSVIRMRFRLHSDTSIMDSELTNFMQLRVTENREKLSKLHWQAFSRNIIYLINGRLFRELVIGIIMMIIVIWVIQNQPEANIIPTRFQEK